MLNVCAVAFPMTDITESPAHEVVALWKSGALSPVVFTCSPAGSQCWTQVWTDLRAAGKCSAFLSNTICFKTPKVKASRVSDVSCASAGWKNRLFMLRILPFSCAGFYICEYVNSVEYELVTPSVGQREAWQDRSSWIFKTIHHFYTGKRT